MCIESAGNRSHDKDETLVMLEAVDDTRAAAIDDDRSAHVCRLSRIFPTLQISD